MQQTMQFSGLGIEPMYGNNMYPAYQMQQQQNMQQAQYQNPQQKTLNIDPAILNAPPVNITSVGEGQIKPKFTIVDESAPDPRHSIPIVNEGSLPPEKKTRKKRRTDTGIMKADDTEHVSGSVEDASTIYTYNETNNLLHETLGQIDAINTELVQEFNAVRNNRTMKNKYVTLNALSENIGALISNRIQTIKEINNCITKANDLDYKKYKDVQAIKSNMNDDKYIADVYQALIQNPQNTAPAYTANVDPSLMGSGIIRANLPSSTDMNNGQVIDSGYLNYISNLTPEQNLMRYENDPNVKQVVVFDESTGNKFFQMMNVATGEVIPNVPVYGENIMEDTTLDIEHGIAKNLNIRENFPIVKINSNPTMAQY